MHHQSRGCARPCESDSRAAHEGTSRAPRTVCLALIAARSLRRKKYTAFAAAGVIFVGAIVYAVSRKDAAPEDRIVALVPSDSVLYGHLFVNPSTRQRHAIDALLSRFGPVDTRDEADDALANVLDRPLSLIGLDFAHDVEPWLGDQAGFFIVPSPATRSSSSALVLSTKNAAATRAALDEARLERPLSDRSHREVSYRVSSNGLAFGFISSFLVAGDEAAFIGAVDALRGTSLAGERKYVVASRSRPAERVAWIYASPSGLARSLYEGGAPDALGRSPIAVSLYARPDALVIETSTGLGDDPGAAGGPRGPSRLVEHAPEAAWASVAFVRGGPLDMLVRALALIGPVRHAHAALRGLSRRLGIGRTFEGIRQGRFFALGRASAAPSAALVLTTTDPVGALVAVARLRKALELRDPGNTGDLDIPVAAGFSFEIPFVRQSANVALRGDRLAVGLGTEATRLSLEPTAGIARRPGYRVARESLGGEYEPFAYLDFTMIRDLYELWVAGPDYDREVRPWIAPLEYVVAGTRLRDSRMEHRFVVGVR